MMIRHASINEIAISKQVRHSGCTAGPSVAAPMTTPRSRILGSKVPFFLVYSASVALTPLCVACWLFCAAAHSTFVSAGRMPQRLEAPAQPANGPSGY